jgi:hypothetical protein
LCLGGVIARAAASQMSDRIASVTTMAAPFRGVSVHKSILRASELVRGAYSPTPRRECATGVLHRRMHLQLPGIPGGKAIPSPTESSTGAAASPARPGVDFEVSATHIGLVFNPIVYDVMAHRLAGKTPNWGKRA